MNLLYAVFLIMVALAFLSVSERAESLDITAITQGTVKDAKNNSINILEDSDGKEVQIAIDSNTVYDNVQKLTDLKAGDEVQVEYSTHAKKKIATTITKMEEENGDNV